MKKRIVLSGINLFSAGPLTIGREFLQAVVASPLETADECPVVFFCHRASLYEDIVTGTPVRLVEKPLSRKSWLFRLFYEYVYFYWWSRRQPVHAWISLHDMTPNVRAEKRVVYCHNPSPFYRGPWAWTVDPRFQLFRLFYSWLYRINLKKNEHVIVQQQWIRDVFVREYGCRPDRVIVATPTSAPARVQRARGPIRREPAGPATIVYPAFPRSFKNLEVILEAMRRLVDVPLELVLTTNGAENRYAASLRKRYGHLPSVKWAGFLEHVKIRELYSSVDAMVFPSKLETWGLPLSEFRGFNKPIFAADLPYAKETLSGYEHACFFDPDDAAALAVVLREFVLRGAFPATPVRVEITPPFARNWEELLARIGLVTPANA